MSNFSTILVTGAGSRGLLYIGGLLYLEKNNLMENVDTFVGISSGSIICLFLAIGYSAEEIMSFALEYDIFQDLTSININNYGSNVDMFDNKKMKKFITEKVVDKYGFIPTLEQLHTISGYNLTFISSNLSDNDLEYHINHISEPNISCVSAVLLSSNIPYLFYNILHKDKKYVDAFTSFPIKDFDDKLTDILVMYVDFKQRSIPTNAENKLITHLYNLLFSAMNENRNTILKNCSNKCKCLKLDVDANYDINFDEEISFEDKCKIISMGYKLTKKFIKSLNNEIIVLKPEMIVDVDSDSDSSVNLEYDSS